MTRTVLLLAVLGLVGLLVVVELSRPPEPDRRLLARPDGQEPFDAEAFVRLLPAWLGATVDTAGTPLDARLGGAGAGTAALFVTDVFDPDSAEAAALVAFARRGGTAVIATHALGADVGRALGPPTSGEETEGVVVTDPSGNAVAPGDLPAGQTWPLDLSSRLDGYRLDPATVRGQARQFAFPVGLGAFALSGLDPARTDTLAVLPEEGPFASAIPVAARVRVGEGAVVVLSVPLAFSNAAVAGEGDAAAFLGLVLGAVPRVERVLWDTRFAPLAVPPSQSLLRVAARTPALAWAVGLFFLLSLLLVVVGGRRLQRPIPVVRAPPNAQAAFARTVGCLHESTGDSGWLARRRARLTVDVVRTRLGLPDAALDDATAAAAARRAGLDEAETVDLFRRLRNLRADPAPDAARVLAADRDAFAFSRAVTAPSAARPAPPSA